MCQVAVSYTHLDVYKRQEWYRGAYASLAASAEELQQQGYPLHRPLRGWIRERLIAGAERLYAWTALLDPLELAARGAASRASTAQRRVVDVLDAYRAEDIDLARWLPASVLDWHCLLYTSRCV